MSIKSKIQSLITAANATTGETDATLTDAVQTLVDGYGGGGAEVYYGTGASYSSYIPYAKVLNFPYDGLPNLGGLTELEEVHAPEYTGSFAANFFRNCTKLRVLDFPKATGVNRSSFCQGCTSLEEVFFPQSTGIGSTMSFTNCSSLVTVQFGSVGHSVTSMPTTSNIFTSSTSHFTFTIYVNDDVELPLPYQPWGATNATIIYRSATTGEVIPV